MAGSRYNSFVVMGVEFNNPSNFCKLLGMYPRAASFFEERGGVDTWVMNKLRPRTPDQVRDLLESLASRGMSLDKARALDLLIDGIKGQVYRKDLNASDPAVLMLYDIVLAADPIAALKKFIKAN